MSFARLQNKWLLVIAANAIVFGGIACYWLGTSAPFGTPRVPSSFIPKFDTSKNCPTLESTSSVSSSTTTHPLGGPEVPDHYCDPYNEAGYFNATDMVYPDITYISLNPSCQPLARNISARITAREYIPDLVNKTMVFFGDSVDRYSVNHICSSTNSFQKETYQEDHNHLWTNKSRPAPNCFPRVCQMEYLNTTIVNYFMYGFDASNVWERQNDKFWEPVNWRDRVNLAFEGLKTLERDEPQVTFINAALWELARFDRVAKLAGVPDSLSFSEAELIEYRDSLTEMVGMIRKRLPRTRLVYRESHFPKKPSAGYNLIDVPRPLRYSGQKVRQLNQVAYHVIKDAGGDYWPIGELTHSFVPKQVLLDDGEYYYPIQLVKLLNFYFTNFSIFFFSPPK